MQVTSPAPRRAVTPSFVPEDRLGSPRGTRAPGLLSGPEDPMPGLLCASRTRVTAVNAPPLVQEELPLPARVSGYNGSHTHSPYPCSPCHPLAPTSGEESVGLPLILPGV